MHLFPPPVGRKRKLIKSRICRTPTKLPINSGTISLCFPTPLPNRGDALNIQSLNTNKTHNTWFFHDKMPKDNLSTSTLRQRSSEGKQRGDYLRRPETARSEKTESPEPTPFIRTALYISQHNLLAGPNLQGFHSLYVQSWVHDDGESRS